MSAAAASVAEAVILLIMMSPGMLASGPRGVDGLPEILRYRQAPEAADIGAAGIAFGYQSGRREEGSGHQSPELTHGFAVAAVAQCEPKHGSVHAHMLDGRCLSKHVGSLQVPECGVELAALLGHRGGGQFGLYGGSDANCEGVHEVLRVGFEALNCSQTERFGLERRGCLGSLFVQVTCGAGADAAGRRARR